MGSASSGPLLLGIDEGGAEFLDPLTLQPLEFDWGGGKMPGFSGLFLRASANGQMFAFGAIRRPSPHSPGSPTQSVPDPMRGEETRVPGRLPGTLVTVG